MSWTHSSRGTALALLVVCSLLTAGTAAALSVSVESAPGESEVGSEVSATVVISDPFTEAPEQWTLRGNTDLQSVSWTVTVRQQGNQVSQNTYGDASFEQALSLDNGGDEVVVEVAGTAPEVANYSYDPPQEYAVASLVKVEGNNPEVIRNVTAVHYTEESREAREAIDAANEAIEATGGNDEAEQLRDSAVSAYDVGNFENAISLAEQAQSTANEARQSQQTTQLILYGVGALVVLAVIAGGVYYWRSQQDERRRLQ